MESSVILFKCSRLAIGKKQTISRQNPNSVSNYESVFHFSYGSLFESFQVAKSRTRRQYDILILLKLPIRKIYDLLSITILKNKYFKFRGNSLLERFTGPCTYLS